MTVDLHTAVRENSETTLDHIRLCIRDVLPGGVAFEGGRPWLPDGACPPTSPVTRRRREFEAGRFYARLALTSIGCSEAALPRGADRAPIWPAGFVGSISHCEGFCGAIAAKQNDFISVGLDIDTAWPIEHDLHDLIGTKDEIDIAENALPSSRGIIAKMIFVAKEAVFKAYWPKTHHFLEFGDVRIDFPPGSDDFWATILSNDAPDLFGKRIFRGRYGVTSEAMFATLLIGSDF